MRCTVPETEESSVNMSLERHTHLCSESVDVYVLHKGTSAIK